MSFRLHARHGVNLSVSGGTRLSTNAGSNNLFHFQLKEKRECCLVIVVQLERLRLGLSSFSLELRYMILIRTTAIESDSQLVSDVRC